MPLMRVNEEGGLIHGGTLFVVATPIGNLQDITLRALDTLRSVDVIAAEDTRHTRKLLSHFQIHKPLTSYHSHNAPQKGETLLSILERGQDIALVTDAGTPGISDPGAMVIRDAVEKGFSVVSIPGPTASIAALVVSGLPTHPFAFLGFAPVKGASRKKFFRDHATLSMTLVLYESPQRLVRTLDDIMQHWGDRRVAAARELTKKFEEIKRGLVSELLAHFTRGVRGEITLIVEGAVKSPEDACGFSHNWEQQLRIFLVEDRMTVRDAAEKVADQFDLPRNLVYRKALELKSGENA